MFSKIVLTFVVIWTITTQGSLLAQQRASNVKVVDKRTMTDASGSIYFMVFAATPYSGQPNTTAQDHAGHSFVVFGVEDRQRRVSYYSAFGFYTMPTSSGGANWRSIFSEVPGQLRNDAMLTTNNRFNRLIVKVNKNVLDAALQRKNQWASGSYQYQLLRRDCVSFAINMAQIAGLNMPNRTGFDNVPWNYIVAMMNAN